MQRGKENEYRSFRRKKKEKKKYTRIYRDISMYINMLNS